MARDLHVSVVISIFVRMRTHLLLIPMLAVGFFSSAQDASSGRAAYTQVETTLSNWDPVRGPWLANSLSSMADNQSIPDRNFPERFTPYQMLSMVPSTTRSEVLKIASDARNNGGDRAFWSDITRYVSSPNCQSSSGRTYGDPHLVSFDGARNSFQTVGEFVLTKSDNGEMEVQTRQKPQSDDFSLNTAVAMNVAGDRVCMYASDFPDGDYSTPLRLNGMPIRMDASTYMLAHGGTIKKVGSEYTFYWPTGESVTAQMNRSGSMEFINVTVKVHDCSEGNYQGLLGNSNGSTRDDYAMAGNSPIVWGSNDDYAQRKRQEYMAKDFAEMHRISQAGSLFDYMAGKNTLSYTDRSFPRVYRDFSDLSDRQMSRARKHCEGMNIDSRDMQGCIYDQAYLGISGSPAPVVPDPVKGTVLRPTEGRIQNVNPPKPIPTVRPETPELTSGNSSGSATGQSVQNGSTPEIRTPKTESGSGSVAPISTPPPAPKIKAQPRPEPVPAPRPPAPAPKVPTPAPKAPAPGPKPPASTPRIGKG